jgi:glycosyltransferase involved in cell wall biosynthesis
MTAKSVLMICYAYPPVIASGVVRTKAFSMLLPEFGWTPTVLSARNPKDRWTARGEPEPNGIRIVRTPELDLHRAVDICQAGIDRLLRPFRIVPRRNYCREFICVPDAQIAWLHRRAGIRLARECDLIFASCAPFSSAVTASLIKKATGKPLVLDFRDPWTLNPHADPLPMRQAIIRRLERFAIRTCDALILNTPGALRLYQKAYPKWAQRMSAIPNGYNRLNLPNPGDRRSQGFRVMHVGSFYGQRGPGNLLEALAALPDTDVEFVQVGHPFPEYERFEGRVRMTVIQSVPHEEALSLMRTASLLYLKQGFEERARDYVAVAAKTYEYLATGLPILADCPPGDNADIVAAYSRDSYVVTSNSPADLRAAVVSAIERRADRLPSVSPEFVRTFDRRALTSRLADVFCAVTGAPPA